MHIWSKDINGGMYRDYMDRSAQCMKRFQKNWLNLCLIVVMDQFKSIVGREFQRRGSHLKKECLMEFVLEMGHLSLRWEDSLVELDEKRLCNWGYWMTLKVLLEKQKCHLVLVVSWEVGYEDLLDRFFSQRNNHSGWICIFTMAVMSLISCGL